MIEIIDEYCWNKNQKLFTHERHKIPGLQNFAHHNLLKALPPVLPHFHSDIVEFHCLAKGRRISHVHSQDYIVTGGECFITFPFEPHSTGEFPENRCEFYSFQIKADSCKNFLGLSDNLRDYLIDMLLNLPHRHYKIGSGDLQNLKAAFDSLTLGGKNNVYLAQQHLCCFLLNVINLEPIIQEQRPDISPSIQKTLEYIELHFKEMIPLSVLAGISGYSLSSFKVKFKSVIGITPAEYLTLRKIEYAKKELAGSGGTITNLAYELGFSSSNYFCTVFKKYTNLTPSQYCVMEQRENAR